MKIKNEKTKLIIWALVSLIIGVIIGLLLTNLVTTGNAIKTIYGGDSVEINKYSESYIAANNACCQLNECYDHTEYTDGGGSFIVCNPCSTCQIIK